jgi:2-(3-amino-3-carboxypropyl)histidine synthase
MKSVFIETKYLKKVSIPKEEVAKLPKRIALFVTVQLIGQLDSFVEQLKGKEVVLVQTKNTMYKGQILGCNIQKIEGDFDAFLYIGDGLFHPKALAFNNSKPIFIFNHVTGEFSELDRNETEAMKKREKAAIIKFHSSDNIGIIVSSKPGQYFAKKAEKLKAKYPDKNFYMFISDTLDFNELENFPFIDVYVNTMCPRIALDELNKINKKIINIDVLI